MSIIRQSFRTSLLIFALGSSCMATAGPADDLRGSSLQCKFVMHGKPMDVRFYFAEKQVFSTLRFGKLLPRPSVDWGAIYKLDGSVHKLKLIEGDNAVIREANTRASQDGKGFHAKLTIFRRDGEDVELVSRVFPQDAKWMHQMSIVKMSNSDRLGSTPTPCDLTKGRKL